MHLRPLLRRPAVVSRPRRTWFPLCNNIRSCFQSFQKTSKPFESSSIIFYGFVWRVFAHQVISVKKIKVNLAAASKVTMAENKTRVFSSSSSHFEPAWQEYSAPGLATSPCVSQFIHALPFWIFFLIWKTFYISARDLNCRVSAWCLLIRGRKAFFQR